MISGTTRPARSSGTPKISPMLEPSLRVRLITSPPIKRTKPMTMAKEKLYALSGVRPGFAVPGSLVFI